MKTKERKNKLEKLVAEKWRLAQAMDDAETVHESFLVMMQLNEVSMAVYYEEMRLAGKTKAQAKKELFEVLEKSGFKYAREVKAIA
jgi:hypothetical protein